MQARREAVEDTADHALRCHRMRPPCGEAGFGAALDSPYAIGVPAHAMPCRLVHVVGEWLLNSAVIGTALWHRDVPHVMRAGARAM